MSAIFESSRWSTLGITVLTSVLMAIAFAFLNRVSASSRPEDGWFTLRMPPAYPPLFLFVGLASIAGAATLCFYRQFVWSGICALAGLFCIWGSHETRRIGWKINSSGLTYCKGETTKNSIAWRSLQSVKLSAGQLEFWARDAKPIAIPHTASGLGALAMHLDDHAPRQIEVTPPAQAILIEAYTQGLLEAGEDPPTWFVRRSGCLTQTV